MRVHVILYMWLCTLGIIHCYTRNYTPRHENAAEDMHIYSLITVTTNLEKVNCLITREAMQNRQVQSNLWPTEVFDVSRTPKILVDEAIVRKPK